MKSKSESGNVIVMIFIAIALLGALTFAFTGSNRTSTALLTGTQLEAYASQMISYGSDVQQAVKRLTLRGCSDTEISFENPVSNLNYTNASAPSDDSCNVFSPKGGGLVYKIMTPEELFPGATQPGQPTFHGNNQISGVGSDAANGGDELTFKYTYVRDDLCMAINDKLGIDNPSGAPPEETDVDFKYTGPFVGTYNSFDHLIATSADLQGKKAVCVYNSSATYGQQNIYYQVLIAR